MTLTSVGRRIPQGIARSMRYVHRMFPLTVLVPVALVQFLSVFLTLKALAGISPLPLGWSALLGTVATALWALLIRIDDDLTDMDHDRRMASRGDARYRDRPTVTGAITRGQLRTLQRAVLGVFLGANLVFGGPATRLASFGGYVLTWLGFRWFFIGALRRNPTPLAHLVRKLLTLLFGLYAAAVVVDDVGLSAITWWVVPVFLAPCVAVAAWDVARKIRIPADETAYATYSKAFGWRNATVLLAGLVVASVACLLPVALGAGLGGFYALALAGAAVVTIGACGRLLAWPSRRHADLGGVARLYGLVAHGGLVLALLLRHGARLV